MTFTEKFALENYGAVTCHGVMIPLYGLVDKFIQIFYIEVVPEDVKMFYELKFKNKLTIDQKLRLIAETYSGRLQIREFSSFGTNISFAEKQLRFVPDWYISANGPITKYILGNNSYSEFYYEPLTEDDKWTRYFGIIPKTVPLITSLFNRTSKVMGRLITGIPIAPAPPPVRESSSRFNRHDPGGGAGPGSALRHATPPASPAHTIDAGEISSPLIRELLDDTVGDSDFTDTLAAAGGLDLSYTTPGPSDKVSITTHITLDEGPGIESGNETEYETTHEDSGGSESNTDIGSEHGSEHSSESDSEHGTEVKSKPVKGLDFTQPEIDALKKRQAKEEEALLALSGEREDLTAAQQRLIGEKDSEANKGAEGPDAASVPSYEEIIDPGTNELYLAEYAPDYSERVTLDTPPAYNTLEHTVIELLPTPKTIQTFMSNVFKIQYQSTLNELKAIASDPTLKRYIPEGTLKSSMNKSAHVKVILKAYTDLVSNQRYDYDEVKEEKVLYNSVAYMLENLGSLTGTKKSELEKIKTDYVSSLKFDPENLKKLSLSERK